MKAKRLKSKLLSENKGISIYRASQITQEELLSFCETLSSENAKKLLDLVEREQSIVKVNLKIILIKLMHGLQIPKLIWLRKR